MSKAKLGKPKTAKMTATVVPKHGRGRLLAGGMPGNKGGTGRRPDEWKAVCQELASDEERLKIARSVLADRDHPAWLGAWKWVCSYAYGQPEQNKNLTISEPLTITIVRE